MLLGRIVRDGEPLWRQEDTDLAMAITAIDADRCDCGHPRSESMDPELEFEWVTEPLRCHACASRDRTARTRPEGWDDAGIRWVTRRRDSD